MSEDYCNIIYRRHLSGKTHVCYCTVHKNKLLFNETELDPSNDYSQDVRLKKIRFNGKHIVLSLIGELEDLKHTLN